MAGSLRLYKSYNFVEKDPIIDRMRSLIASEGVKYSEVSEHSGVSVNTLYQWFDGKTMRPQFATVMAVARSLGYDVSLVKVERKASAKIVVFKPRAAA